VPIRVSATKQIDALLADLATGRAVAREAAIARLTVIGSRAVDRLIALAADRSASSDARTAAWRTLEAIGDARTIDHALTSLTIASDPPDVTAAAAAALRTFVKGARGASVVDALTATALDRGRLDLIRLAALRALRELAPKTLAPIAKSLARDPSAAMRAEAGGEAGAGPQKIAAAERRAMATAGQSAQAIASAAERDLGDDPAGLRAAIANAGATVAAPMLLRIVERVREREGAEAPARRGAWQLARAAAHQALADRGSRIALYDLRESLEKSNGALPVELFPPLTLIGDASCLAAVAAAHAAATDAWQRRHLSDLFYTIVTRERVSKERAAALWASGTRGVKKRRERRLQS
jgi:hypothetical protein